MWPTSRLSLKEIFRIRELVWGRLGLCGCSEQIAVQPRESFGRSVARNQPQDSDAPSEDESAGSVDQFFDHCLQAPSFDDVMSLSSFGQQTERPNKAKSASGQFLELEDKVIDAEIVRQQLLQIEVGLEVRVELSMRVGGRIQGDDGPHVELPRRQLRRLVFEHEVAQDPCPTIGVDGAFDQIHSVTHSPQHILNAQVLYKRRNSLALGLFAR